MFLNKDVSYIELAKSGKLTSWEVFSEQNPLTTEFCFSVNDEENESLLIREETPFYVVEYSQNVNEPPYLNLVITVQEEDETDLYGEAQWLFEWAKENARKLPNRKERIEDYIEYLQVEVENL